MTMKAWIKEEINNSPTIVAGVRWYKGLNSKQRLLVNTLLSIASCLMVFSMVLSAGIDNLNASNQNHINSEKLYQRVKENVGALSTLTNTTSRFIDRPANELQSIVDKSLRRYQIEPDSISSIGSDKVSLEFTNVSFQKLAKFIQQVENEKVGVDSFYVEPQESGNINLSIVFD